MRVGDDPVLPPLHAPPHGPAADVARAEAAIDDRCRRLGDRDRHLGSRNRVHVGRDDRPPQPKRVESWQDKSIEAGSRRSMRGCGG